MKTTPTNLPDADLDNLTGAASTPKLQEAVCKGRVFPR